MSEEQDRINAELFYRTPLMPCCFKPVKYIEGPRGGLCINIECAHCGTRWNICRDTQYIAKI